MATVVDELVVQFGLDPTKFTDGQRRAMEEMHKVSLQAQRSGKEVEASGQKVVEYFESVKRGALTVTAALFGGYAGKQAIEFITNLDASTGRFAKTMNLTVEELSAWQGAAKQAGGSAESITSTMQGLSSAMNTFMLTGQGPFLGIMNHLKLSLFDENKKMKTSGQMLLEVADAVHKLNAADPARAAATLSMIPGMNQESINLMIEGRKRIEDLLEASRRAGVATKESAAAAAEYQKQLSLLEQSSTSAGRSILQIFLPSLIAAFQSIAKLMADFKDGKLSEELPTAGKKIFGYAARDMLEGPMRAFAQMIGATDEKSQKQIDDFFGIKRTAPVAPAAAAAATRGGSGALASEAEREAYIRSSAIKRGIDPDVAVKVAKSEGFYTYAGDMNTSFGAFQLHYKNNIPGLSNSGLGDVFTKKTGLDARNPTTEREQIDFALDEAKKSGWGAWHGFKGMPFQGINRGGAPAMPGLTNNSNVRGDTSQSQTITVGSVVINAPNASNANDIAREIPDAIKRQNFASAANSGQV